MAAETTSTSATPKAAEPKGANALAIARSQKRKSKVAGRKKRTLKLKTDKEFAKAYFEARSKRATDKKSTFRKKKSKKK